MKQKTRGRQTSHLVISFNYFLVLIFFSLLHRAFFLHLSCVSELFFFLFFLLDRVKCIFPEDIIALFVLHVILTCDNVKICLVPYVCDLNMQVKHGLGVEEITNHILQGWESATGNKRR